MIDLFPILWFIGGVLTYVEGARRQGMPRHPGAAFVVGLVLGAFWPVFLARMVWLDMKRARGGDL